MSVPDNKGLRALLATATPGPWFVHASEAIPSPGISTLGYRIAEMCHPAADSDARLLALARDLAEEVIALRARAETAEAAALTLAAKVPAMAQMLDDLGANVAALRAEVDARKDARAELLALREALKGGTA